VIPLLRSLLYSVVFYGGTFAMTLAGTVVLPFRPQWLIVFAQAWARLGIWSARVFCGVRVSVVGQENLHPQPVLIASRHQSAFDTMVWFTLLPNVTYVMKQELLRIPLMGRLMAAAGMIAVDRDGGARTIRMLVKDGKRAAAAGRSIVIFPEGTRAEPGALLPLQPGVAALASATGLPVVPVLTDSGKLWGRRSFIKRAGTIHVVICPPLMPGLERGKLMGELQRQLESEIRIKNHVVDKSVNQLDRGDVSGCSERN
jgi:1-acyl-sn-glycerol-3-phosphate acyltransferase